MDTNQNVTLKDLVSGKIFKVSECSYIDDLISKYPAFDTCVCLSHAIIWDGEDTVYLEKAEGQHF